MSRDPDQYTADESKRYHPRKWKSQKIFPAITFDLGIAAAGRIEVLAQYRSIVEAFYGFLMNSLGNRIDRQQATASDSFSSPDRRRISGREQGRLHEEILATFNEGELIQLVRTQLEQDFATIVSGSNFSDKAFSLLGWALRNDRLNDLVTAAHTARPNSVILAELANKHESKPGRLR